MAQLPLEGIRILDNGIVQAGTFPARLLADFGAEVVRVENYRSPDLSRNAIFPSGRPGDPYWEGGGIYHEQFRNKEFCVGLDVRKPQGRDVFLRLAAKCDIVLDSHPPGVMEKLRLDYESLQEVKPDIIYISTSGYGYGGPYSHARSYGMMTEIMCGSGWLNGYEGGESRRGACPLTDHPATYHAAFLMMAALLRRKKTGVGGWIDLSQYEIGVNILGDAHLAQAMGATAPARVGSVDPGALFSGCFRSSGSDRWVTVSVSKPGAFASLSDVVGFSQGGSSAAVDHESLATGVRDWAAERTAEEAAATLLAVGVAAAPVNSVRELLLDPHLEERGFFWTVRQAPEQHSGLRAWPGASAKLSETPAELRHRAPMLGEHNRIIATGLLGYSAEEYEQLEALEAVGTTPAAAAMKPPPQDIEARKNLDPAAASAKAREVDLDVTSRLRTRFGDAYAR